MGEEMPLAASEQHFRLADQPGSLGLNCQSSGVSLAGVPLLRKTARGFSPRTADEIGALMKCAYGPETDAIRLTRGLDVVADALNRGDLGRAMIASVHLRLAELSFDGAARIARAEDLFAKYDPSEPRDERGRWTTGGGAEASASARGRRTPIPTGPIGQRRNFPGLPLVASPAVEPEPQNASASHSSQSWGGPVHLYGGRITPVGGPGSNGPPEDFESSLIPETEPDYNPSPVPLGFDTPGHRAGGLEYSPSRQPKLPNGEPWPVATPEYILATLRLQPGKTPRMYIFVPRDGLGPILSGSTAREDLPEPKGYDAVLFVGRPQFTPLGDGESPHARESIVEGLRLAGEKEFSTVLFNSTLSTIARYVEPPNELAVESVRRPDVAAITKPSLERPDRIVPYEILSGRQTIDDRREEMPPVPGIRLIDGRHYKQLERFSMGWFRRLGVRPLCL